MAYTIVAIGIDPNNFHWWLFPVLVALWLLEEYFFDGNVWEFFRKVILRALQRLTQYLDWKDYTFEQSLTTKTIEGFSVPYVVTFRCQREIDSPLSNLNTLIFSAEALRTAIVDHFQNESLGHICPKEGYGFCIPFQKVKDAVENDTEAVPSVIHLAAQTKEKVESEAAETAFSATLRENPFAIEECKVTVTGFRLAALSNAIIEENYRMLTDKQKDQLSANPQYKKIQETLSVAVLKRRLDFQMAQCKQTHDASWIVVRTERAGRWIRLSWEFKQGAPAGYVLMGFRKTGGFHPDQWDTKNNGELVMDSPRSGDTLEKLEEGETYYYTFILVPPGASDNSSKYSIARFKITMPTAEEVNAMLGVVPPAPPPPPATPALQASPKEEIPPEMRPIYEALKHIATISKANTLFLTAVNGLKSGIEQSSFSEEEKVDQIERLEETAAVYRERAERQLE